MNASMRAIAALLIFYFLIAQQVNAAGFYLSEFGTPASTGTAGVANPTITFTADAAYTNPAGMTGMSEDSILVGATYLDGKVEFDSDVATAGGSDGGNSLEPIFIPSVFYTKVLSEKSRFGLSMVVPIGGGVDYGDDFVGRYSVQSVELSGLTFTPSFGYEVNDQVSIGVGVSFIQMNLDQEVAINTLLPPGDGKAKLDDLDDQGFQGILGLTVHTGENTLLGVVYRTETNIEFEGDLKVEGTAVPIPNQGVDLEWDNPQTLEMGLRHQLNDQKTLFFNLGWQEWSAFSKNVLTLSNTGISTVTDRNWDDTWHAGIAYAQNLDGGKHYTLGLAYESSPVSDKDRTFDFPVDEMWKLASKFSWPVSNKSDFAVGAMLTLVGDAAVDETAQGTRASGEFDEYLTYSLSGTWRYVF